VLANFPIEERITAPASRTLPCPFSGIVASLMKHPDDEVTAQAHGLFAVNELGFWGSLHKTKAIASLIGR